MRLMYSPGGLCHPFMGSCDGGAGVGDSCWGGLAAAGGVGSRPCENLCHHILSSTSLCRSRSSRCATWARSWSGVMSSVADGSCRHGFIVASTSLAIRVRMISGWLFSRRRMAILCRASTDRPSPIRGASSSSRSVGHSHVGQRWRGGGS